MTYAPMRLVALITVAVLALFAVIFYVDMPLAELFQSLGLWPRLRSVGMANAPVMLAAGTAAVVLGCCCLVFRLPFAKLCRSATLAGFATLLSYVIVKEILKKVFGRTFPFFAVGQGGETFHWFSPLLTARSFPSTHAAELAAILTVLWIRHPRWKAAYVLAAVAMNATMMLGEWHFLSDILVGTVIGIGNATLVMAIAKRVAARLPAAELAKWSPVAGSAKLSQ